MMKKVLMAAVAVTALLTATVASAGMLYLPLAANQTIEGVQYRSIVWITNNGQGPAQVDLRFIPTGTDGAVGLEADPVVYDETLVIAPGTTFVTSAALGSLGMLEITSEGNIHALSELNAFSPSGQKLTTTSVPLLDAGNILSPGETAQLLALERQINASQTNLGLVNLNNEESECRIESYDALGQPIAGAAIITVPPLGHREFNDALGILGVPSIDGARFAVTCDSPFYTYATLLSRFPEAIHFVTPAAGGNEALAGPPQSGTILNRPGQFFAASRSNPLQRVALPLEQGVDYQSVTVEVDMFVPGSLPTTLFTSTLQLRRAGRNGLFWAHTIRGGGRLKTLLDMGVGDGLVHQGSDRTWGLGSTYRVVAVYDVELGQIDWQVYRGNRQVERLVRSIGRFDLRHDGQGIDLIFGQDKVYDNAFFPPWGFRFSNLRVSAVATTQ